MPCARKERQDQMVLAIDQGAHACDALLLEARDQRVEQLAADAALAQLGIDLDGEHPTPPPVGRTSQARTSPAMKPAKRAFVGLSDQEMPLGRQHLLPIGGLSEPVNRASSAEIASRSVA